jgi:3-deoxy-7-phosphoheptulonate synthase
MPVGFKNATDGSLQIALDAMSSARTPHNFLGIDQEGATCVIRTTGNPVGHVVLRGGRKMTNYDAASINGALAEGITGMMVESFLNEGSQPFPQPVAQLQRGVSITDACIGWETTERLLRHGHERLAGAAGVARDVAKA